ncbi:MAG: aldo/keto reductase [Chloroflexi bacterium]|jgi:predicted aldo/keto reductase-like oxidoreductase|nr:aldo/keto reductase [Chloroflexota bacterium]
MQYRQFGKLDMQVSALGFGCMRLPTNGSTEEVNEPEATRMLHYAIDHGVNYIDTAYPYHGGNSEKWLGRALQGGYRDKVKLATKLPCWQTDEYADFDRLLNEQLERLQTDHIDFYLLHSLSQETWTKAHNLDVLRWAEGAIADGRIGYLGFSFHDHYDVFQQIVDAYDKWTFCQIQYNYLNQDYQAGTRGLEYAAASGLAVVIMEPLLGGSLVNPPDAVQALWDSAPTRRSAPDWALQWLWNKPQVSLVLSGMTTMQQVRDNVASADRSGIGTLTAQEVALVEQVRQTYQSLCVVPCTGCKYCMPCPNGVNIPANFELLNNGIMYNQMEEAIRRYATIAEGEGAGSCIECHQCEANCPQHISIADELARVREALGAQVKA